MTRSALLLDIVLILVLSLVILLLSNLPAEPKESVTVPVSPSSALAVLPALSLPILPFPSLPVSEGLAQGGEVITEPETKTAQTQPAPLDAHTSAPLLRESTPLEEAAATLRKALVNIICIAPSGSGIRSISGSGITVDPKGYILTNAHIAQFFLLANRGVVCTVRAGSPATPRYRAALTYIPSTWVETNADILTKKNPVGTGEHDYALLAITKSATTTPLPAQFLYTPLSFEPPKITDAIAIASYGSQFLANSDKFSALFPTVVFGSVKDVFTFRTRTVDVLELGGSSAAQQGSSGGGVVSEEGELIGLITTSSTEGEISSRSLNAITTSYIRTDYKSATGESLDLLLSRATTTAVAAFAPKIPALREVVTSAIQ